MVVSPTQSFADGVRSTHNTAVVMAPPFQGVVSLANELCVPSTPSLGCKPPPRTRNQDGVMPPHDETGIFISDYGSDCDLGWSKGLKTALTLGGLRRNPHMGTRSVPATRD